MTSDNRRFTAVATGQLGSFSRRQAHAAGISDRQPKYWEASPSARPLRSRVQSGFLEPIGVHAFRLIGADHGMLGELNGLLLDVGEPCWASGPTAAAVHGFDGFTLRRPFHVSVTRDRNVRRMGAIVHTTEYLPEIDRETADGLAITSPTRTIIDLAGYETSERLATAMDSAFRDGLSAEDLLHRRIAALRGRGRFGIPKLLAVFEGQEITRGGHSWLEREFLRLLAAAGLPKPLTQQMLTKAGDRLVRVDCRFPGTNVVVELLGYRYHRTKQQLARDAERLNALVLDGFAPYQFTYEQVVDAAETVIATVNVALRRSE
jgi:hypothetical protein